MPRSLPAVHFTDAQDGELAEYRSLPGLVVVALIFGLLSPLAMVDQSLWFVPLLGVFVGVWAVRRVKSNASAMTGRKRAIFGLALSLLFLVAAPTESMVSRRMLNQQAQEMAREWFRLVLENHPRDARGLMLVIKKDPVAPTPGAPEVPKVVDGKSESERDVEAFEQGNLVKSLVALGPGARVRFYQTHDQIRDGANDLVQLVYAVTYEEGGEKKSFFVCADVRRIKLSNSEFDWRVYNVVGPFQPKG